MRRATSWTSVLVPDDGDPRHGLNGYNNLGCRCDVCRDAATAYNRGLRETLARRLAADPSIRPHGDPNTYLNYGCRCRPCTDAKAAAALARHHARKAGR